MKTKDNISKIKPGEELEYFYSKMNEEERLEVETEVRLISELVKARNENKITQKQLEELSGIKQSAIARLEGGKSDPRLSTLIKISRCLNKRIYIGS